MPRLSYLYSLIPEVEGPYQPKLDIGKVLRIFSYVPTPTKLTNAISKTQLSGPKKGGFSLKIPKCAPLLLPTLVGIWYCTNWWYVAGAICVIICGTGVVFPPYIGRGRPCTYHNGIVPTYAHILETNILCHFNVITCPIG